MIQLETLEDRLCLSSPVEHAAKRTMAEVTKKLKEWKTAAMVSPIKVPPRVFVATKSSSGSANIIKGSAPPFKKDKGFQIESSVIIYDVNVGLAPWGYPITDAVNLVGGISVRDHKSGRVVPLPFKKKLEPVKPPKSPIIHVKNYIFFDQEIIDCAIWENLELWQDPYSWEGWTMDCPMPEM